jgi:hypothetical protein
MLYRMYKINVRSIVQFIIDNKISYNIRNLVEFNV